MFWGTMVHPFCHVCSGSHHRHHKVSGLRSRNVLPHRSGRYRSEIQTLLARLLPSEASLLGLQMAAFSLGPRGVFPLCGLCPNLLL